MRDNLLSSLPDETEPQSEVKQQQRKSTATEEELRRDLLSEDFNEHYPNIYKTIVVISQRARQIGQKQGRIVDQFMAAKARPDDDDDDDEEIFRSLEDDDEEAPRLPRLEKPTVTAMNEMYRGLLEFNKEE